MSRKKYEPVARQVARKYGLPEDIFVAQITQESGWNPTAKSNAGALGLGQLLPTTAKALGVKNPFDPVENLNGAARYMQQNLKRYGSIEMALAAYNGGPGAVDYFKNHGGIFHNPKASPNSWANQTGGYVQKIMKGSTASPEKKSPNPSARTKNIFEEDAKEYRLSFDNLPRAEETLKKLKTHDYFGEVETEPYQPVIQKTPDTSGANSKRNIFLEPETQSKSNIFADDAAEYKASLQQSPKDNAPTQGVTVGEGLQNLAEAGLNFAKSVPGQVADTFKTEFESAQKDQLSSFPKRLGSALTGAASIPTDLLNLVTQAPASLGNIYEGRDVYKPIVGRAPGVRDIPTLKELTEEYPFMDFVGGTLFPAEAVAAKILGKVKAFKGRRKIYDGELVEPGTDLVRVDDVADSVNPNQLPERKLLTTGERKLPVEDSPRQLGQYRNVPETTTEDSLYRVSAHIADDLPTPPPKSNLRINPNAVTPTEEQVPQTTAKEGNEFFEGEIVEDGTPLPTSKNDLLNLKDSTLARVSNLPSSAAADVERATQRMVDVEDMAFPARQARARTFSEVNDWVNTSKASLAKDLGMNEHQLQEKIINTGILDEVVRTGRSLRVAPQVNQRLVQEVNNIKTADEQFNKSTMRTLGFQNLDMDKLSDVQRGNKVMKIDESKLNPQDRQALKGLLANNVSKLFTPITKTGDIDFDEFFIKVGDSEKEMIKGIEDARETYTNQGLGFLFNPDGTLKRQLLKTELNLKTQAADLPWFEKLNPEQANLIREKARQAGVSTSQVSDVLSGSVRPMDNPHYKKFVASLQTEKGRLVFKDVDPYQKVQRQAFDLSKKVHDEPIINKIRETIQEIEELKGQNKYRNLDAKYRLESEQMWLQSMENVLRNVPTRFDEILSQALAFPGLALGKYAGGALDAGYNVASKTPLRRLGVHRLLDKDLIADARYIQQVMRTRVDQANAVETAFKLSFNFTADLMNVFEGLRTAGIEAGDATYARLTKELVNPVKFFDNTIQIAKQHPDSYAILQQQGLSGAANTAPGFWGKKFLGSKKLGKIRDFGLYGFQDSALKGRLMAFRILYEAAKDAGYVGKNLDQQVSRMLRVTKNAQDFDIIPMINRSPAILKPLFLFKRFMFGLVDTYIENYRKFFKDPNLQNIKRIVFFSTIPVLMFGPQTDPGITAVNMLFSAGSGLVNMAQTGKYQERNLLEEARAMKTRPQDNPDLAGLVGGTWSRGVIGQFTNFDTTRLFNADLENLLNQKSPYVQGETLAKTYDYLSGLYRDVGEALTDNATGLGWKALDATTDYVSSITTFGNRLKQAGNILSGGFRDSQGQLVQKVTEPDRLSMALSVLLGFRPATIQEGRIQSEVLMKDAELLDAEKRDLLQRAFKADQHGDKQETFRLLQEAQNLTGTSVREQWENQFKGRETELQERTQKRLGKYKSNALRDR